jgi:hypothetical protein
MSWKTIGAGAAAMLVIGLGILTAAEVVTGRTGVTGGGDQPTLVRIVGGGADGSSDPVRPAVRGQNQSPVDGPSDPATTSGETDTRPTEPSDGATTEPDPAQPSTTQPPSSEPTPSQPSESGTTTEPAPTNPTPTDPTNVQSTQTQSGASGSGVTADEADTAKTG